MEYTQQRCLHIVRYTSDILITKFILNRTRIAAVQNPVGRRPIIAFLSALYIVILGQGCVQWYYLIFSFVTEGNTRLSIFVNSSGMLFPFSLILLNVLWNMALLLADGLLVCMIYACPVEGNTHNEGDLEMFSRLCTVLASNLSAIISLWIGIR